MLKAIAFDKISNKYFIVFGFTTDDIIKLTNGFKLVSEGEKPNVGYNFTFYYGKNGKDLIKKIKIDCDDNSNIDE